MWRIAGMVTCFRTASVAAVPVNMRAPVSSFVIATASSPVPGSGSNLSVLPAGA
jgi:hypothetical protein